MSFAADSSSDRYEEAPYSGPRSLSPIRSDLRIHYNDQNLNNKGQSQHNMTALLSKFIQKDKENEQINKENRELKDKLKEFEYLIIKGSEEVKRKQGEINTLNSIVDKLKQTIPDAVSIENLQRQFDESQRELHQLRSEAAQTQTRLRVELQREKEQNSSLNKQVSETKYKYDDMFKESRGSIDDLQKNFTMTSQKYINLEKDYSESRALIKELTTEIEVKNQTLDHAHQVISRLKQEIEEIVLGGEGAQKKVKEYKGKCKTLKKMNEAQKQQMKELEERMSNYEELKEDLAQARVNIQEISRARLEERFKVDEKNMGRLQENESLNRLVNELKHKISSLEGEYSEVSARCCDAQMKYENIRNSLADKDKQIHILEEELGSAEEKFTKELQTFKKQALRSFQVLNTGHQETLPPTHSRNTSPLKYGSRGTEARRPLSEAKENGLGGTSSIMLRRNLHDTPTDKRNSSLRRATPIKIYNQKGEFEFESKHSARENSEVTFSNIEPAYSSREVRAVPKEHNRINDSLFEGIENSMRVDADKTFCKEGELKTNVTVELLKEDLQRSIEREEYLVLIIETLCARAEVSVKEFLEKLDQQPQENQETLAWRTKSEETEKKYNETLAKLEEATGIIFQLIENNKKLRENLDIIEKDYGKIAVEKKGETEQIIIEQKCSQTIQRSLIKEFQLLIDLLNHNKLLSETGELRNFEALQKVTQECDKYQNCFKVLEQLLETNNTIQTSESSERTPRKSTGNSGDTSARRRRSSRQHSEGRHDESHENPVMARLKRKLEDNEVRIRQLEVEKRGLSEKLTGLTEEVKDWKEAAGMIDNEYQKTLDEKEQIIIKKDEIIRRGEKLLKTTEESLQRTELLLIEKEELSLRQNRELNEMLGRDLSINTMLEEKSEDVRELTRQKYDLCQRLEDVNQHSATIKRELLDKSRDLSHKNGLLNALQAEMLLKDQDLDIKERELQTKFDEIFRLERAVTFKDQEISQLKSENANMKSQVLDHRDQSMRTDHRQSISYIPRMSYNETGYNTPGNKLPTRDTDKWGSNDKRLSGVNRGERSSVPTIRKEEIRGRGSYGGQPEGPESNYEEDYSIRLLKEKNMLLTMENKELFEKLNKLNDLISYNKTLEHEIGTLKAGNLSRSGILDSSSKIYGDTEMGRVQTDGDCFNMGYIEKVLHLPSEHKKDKEILKQLRNNIKDEETAQFVEQYKAKTKKVFQKRVKELEMLLRFVDQKTKGYNFDRLTYTICTIHDEPDLADEKKTFSKLNSFVEAMLEKNGNLKGFVESMIKRIEDLYIRNYNLNILLGSFIKTSTINGIESKDQEFLQQLDSVPEFDDFIKLDIPELISHFNEIEVLNQHGNSNNAKFYKTLTTIKPSINILLNYLSKEPAQNNNGRANSFSFSAKAEDFITSKSDKLKEVEGLYLKLIEIINKNDKTQNSLPDHVKGYIQTYNNIYATVMNEAQSVISFASNLVNGLGMSQFSEGPGDVSGNFDVDNTQNNSKLSASQGISQSISLSIRKPIRREDKASPNLRDTQQNSILNNRSVNISGNSSPERMKFYSKSNSYTPTKNEENEENNNSSNVWIQTSRV